MFACRSLTNPHIFILSQFRYQFIPNALTGLIILSVAGKGVSASPRIKHGLIAMAIACIIAMNAYCSIRSWLYVHSGLTPLRRMIASITGLIDNGTLSKKPGYIWMILW